MEINPDIYDQDSPTVVTQVNPQQQAVQARIAEQQKILETCNAQIKVKAREVEATRQDLIANGNEAGQAEALQIHENEMANLRRSLTPTIARAEATLASLQSQAGTVTAHAQPAPSTSKTVVAKLHRKPASAAMLRASVRRGQ